MELTHKRLKQILIGLVCVFLATFVFYIGKLLFVRYYIAHYQEPPVTVSAQKAVSETWHPVLKAAGTLKASNGVDVNSQVNGQITAIYFTSGTHVKQGDVLVQLDDSVDQQTLLKDQAALRYNQVDYQRKSSLIKQHAVAQSGVDAAQAAYLQAQAAVQSDQVIISQKQIKAPFSGRIGIRQVNIGQYITPSTSIVTLQALDPLFVDFSLPEQDFPSLKVGQQVTVEVDAYPGRVFNGVLSAVNSAIDINTRSIDVRATLPNPGEVLYPGLFGSVNVILPALNNVVTVPQSAVNYSMYGDSVYIVKEEGKGKKSKLIAQERYVTIGDRRGNVVAITKGITPGETVVTSGQLKLHPGSVVVVSNVVNLN